MQITCVEFFAVSVRHWLPACFLQVPRENRMEACAAKCFLLCVLAKLSAFLALGDRLKEHVKLVFFSGLTNTVKNEEI